jgi:NADH-quinone oxidoreductase subunit E
VSVRRLDPVQPASFAFTAENLAWAKRTIEKYPPGKQASAVIPVLWRAQEQNDGWVSQKAIEAVADLLDMSYIRVLEVATFYTMFQLSPVGTRAHIQVCGTTPCMLRGAEDLKKVCQRKIHHEPHHLNEDGSLSWEEVECLGSCVNAPMVQVFKDTYEDLTPEKLEEIIDAFAAGKTPKPGPQNGRQFSAPEGGPTALTDKSLYSGQRSFTRVEPPPPPAPAAPAAAPAPAPVAAAPAAAAPVVAKPAEPVKIEPKPVTPERVVEVKADKAPAPNTAADLVKPRREPEAPKVEVKPVTPERVVPVTDPKAPAPNTEADRAKPRRAAPEKDADAPERLKKPRAGAKADDLKLIWGVGPGLEKMLNTMGFWHFDQLASWTAKELKWVDDNLKGFKGRASRDEWVKQARKLATGWRPENAIGDKPTGKKK